MRLISRWQNSAGERVRIALGLKGLAFDYLPVGTLSPAVWRRVNPQGLLPALQVGDRVIAQSAAILEYLEERYPQRPLLPADPLDRAEARAFAQLIASDLHPLNNNRVRRYLAERMAQPEPAIRDWYRHWMRTGLAALEAGLAARRRRSRFCFGETPGWAELHLVPQLANARRFDVDLSEYPGLLDVEGLCVPLKAFRDARPEAQPDYPGTAGSRGAEAPPPR